MIRLVLAFFLFTATPFLIAEERGPFKILQGHASWVQSIAFTPDGKCLLSGSDDQTLRSWDLLSGKSQTLREFESPIMAIAVHHTGERTVVGRWSGGLEICDVRSGQTLVRFPGHDEAITALSFDPTGQYLATGSADDTLIIWDASNGENLLTFQQGNEYDVTTVAFSPDGKRIATGDGENGIKIWDTETGDEVMSLQGHTATVTSATFSPDGKRIVSASWDKTLRVWDAMTGEPLATLNGHAAEVSSVKFSPNGRLLFSAGDDKAVRVWNTSSQKPLFTFQGHTHSALCLAVSNVSGLLASGGNGRIYVLEVLIMKLVRPTSLNVDSRCSFTSGRQSIVSNTALNPLVSCSKFGSSESMCHAVIWKSWACLTPLHRRVHKSFVKRSIAELRTTFSSFQRRQHVFDRQLRCGPR